MDDHSHSSYAPRSPDLSSVNMQPHPDLWGTPTQPLPPPLGPPKHEHLDFLPGPPSNDWFSHTAGGPTHDPFAGAPLQQHPHHHHLHLQQQLPPVKAESKPAEPPVYKPYPGELDGTNIKTKFPVARIKRIVQADEDVGKVAQVTPVVVSKALELFMTSLALNAAAVAKARGSKRVTGAHLKLAVAQDDQFDFLQDIVDKIPDPPAASSAAMKPDPAGPDARKPRARKGRKTDATSDDDANDDMRTHNHADDDNDDEHPSRVKRKPRGDGTRARRKTAAPPTDDSD